MAFVKYRFDDDTFNSMEVDGCSTYQVGQEIEVADCRHYFVEVQTLDMSKRLTRKSVFRKAVVVEVQEDHPLRGKTDKMINVQSFPRLLPCLSVSPFLRLDVFFP